MAVSLAVAEIKLAGCIKREQLPVGGDGGEVDCVTSQGPIAGLLPSSLVS